MKLLYSPASPYARKVRACAVMLGLDRQIEVAAVDTAGPDAALVSANPLGRIPTLITEDGLALFDSRVICGYLNDIADGATVIPAAGAARWRCLRLEALGDGIMDAAVDRRRYAVAGLDADLRLAQRHVDAITRTLDLLEREVPPPHVDLGVISVCCALGYLEFRFESEPWREGRPALSAWHAQLAGHAFLAATAP